MSIRVPQPVALILEVVACVCACVVCGVCVCVSLSPSVVSRPNRRSLLLCHTCKAPPLSHPSSSSSSSWWSDAWLCSGTGPASALLDCAEDSPRWGVGCMCVDEVNIRSGICTTHSHIYHDRLLLAVVGGSLTQIGERVGSWSSGESACTGSLI